MNSIQRLKQVWKDIEGSSRTTGSKIPTKDVQFNMIPSKLSEVVGLNSVVMTSVYSKTSGVINIKQSEVLESLRQTHPEYFV